MLARFSNILAGVNLFFAFTGVFVVACLLLGGSTAPGFLSDVILQLLAVPLLLAGVWLYLDIDPENRPRSAVLLMAAIAAVPVVQLVPLPPELWSLLPGRSLLRDSRQLANEELSWASLSVSPAATWLSLLSLLPPSAVFLAIALSDLRQRRQLSLIILGMAAGSVILGFIQLDQGQNSPLRFYTITNPEEAVGFFANRNHLAALIYAAIPFTVAWALQTMSVFTSSGRTHRFDAGVLLPVLVVTVLLVVLIAGQIATRSRAGVGLSMLALLAGLALGVSHRRAFGATPRVKLLLGSTVIVALLIAQFALYRLFDRFAADPVADARIPMARNTIEAAWAFFPFGSGIGTFVPVYGTFEKPLDLIANAYANRAHNDVLEIWLEAGLFGAAVILFCAVWFGARAIRAWNDGNSGVRRIDLLLAQAASVALLLLLVHSLFDYPLRTAAIMCIVAFAGGLLVDPPGGHSPVAEYEDDGRRASRRAPGVFPWPEAAAAREETAGAPAWSRPALSGRRWDQGVAWPEEWRKSPGAHGRPGHQPPRKEED